MVKVIEKKTGTRCLWVTGEKKMGQPGNKQANKQWRRWRIYPVFFAVFFSCLFVFASNVLAVGGTIEWKFNYTRPGLQEATSSTNDADGNIYITGYTIEGSDNYLTVKVNSDGTFGWSQPFDLSGSEDRPTALVIDQYNDVIVTGYAFNGADIDIHTIKYCGDVRLPDCASPGQVLWQHTYSSPVAGDDYPTAVAVDPGNNIYVGGYTQTTAGPDDFLLLKYNANGPTIENKPIWVRTYNGLGNSHDRISSIDAGLDVIAVTGYSRNSSNNFDYLTLTYGLDGSSGWVTYHDAAGADDQAIRVGIDTNGDIIVTGFVHRATNRNIYTLKYNKDDGSVAWFAEYAGPYEDAPRDIHIDTDNDVYLTGAVFTPTGFTDIYTVRYDSIDGSVKWEEFFNSDNGNTDIPTAITVDPAGDVFVTGYTHKDAGGDDDFQTVKYRKDTGKILWNVAFNGHANKDDKAIGIGINNAGELFVTGWSDKTLPADGDPRTAGDGGLNTVTLSDGSWTADQWAGYEVVFTSGLNTGCSRKITSNTTDTLSFAPDLEFPVNTGDTFYIGAAIATDGTASTIINSARSWLIDQWTGYTLVFTSGPNSGQTRTITDNTADTVTFTPDIATPVSSGDLYFIKPPPDYDYFALKYDHGRLNPPTNLDAEAVSTSEVVLNWTDNSGNEEGFEIYRKENESDDYPAVPYDTVGTGITTYSDTNKGAGLTPHQKYFYKIRAYNASDEIFSHYSNEASARTTILDYPAPQKQFSFDSSFQLGDYATDIAVGPDNHPVVTGYSYEDIGKSYDYYTVKIDRTTMQIFEDVPGNFWQARYDDIDGELDIATCLAVDSNNDVTVSGFSSLGIAGQAGNTNDIYTIKYPGAGLPPYGDLHQWNDQYNGPDADDDRSSTIDTATDGSDNVVVIGYGKNKAGNDDIYVLKYNADGTRIWPAGEPESPLPYDGGGNDYPSAVVFDANGDVIITGETYNSATDYDIFTRKYSGVDGSEIWTRVYDHTGGWDVGNDIAIDSQGNIYVAGIVTNSTGNHDFYTMKYSGATGADMFAAPLVYNGVDDWHDEAASIVVDSNDNSFIVAGTTYDVDGRGDFYIVKYDSDGNELWNKLLDRPANDDEVIAMAVDVSGNVCIAGNTDDPDNLTNPGTLDIVAIKYDSEGNILGSTLFAGAGDDVVSAITASTLGETYIAGYSVNNADNADYLVISCEGEVLQSPSPLIAVPYYVHVDLTWTANVPDADGYNLRKQLGPCAAATVDNWLDLPSLPADQTIYTDTNLAPGDTYCYQIQTFKTGSANSRWIEKTVQLTDPPPPADFIAKALNTSGIELTWTDNINGEDGFKIQRCAGDNCDQNEDSFIDLTDLPAGIENFEDRTVCEGMSYTYRIISYNDSLWTSREYAFATVSTVAKVPPIMEAAITQSEGRIDIDWSDANSDETGFHIYRCIDTGGGCTPSQPADLVATIESPVDSVVSLKMQDPAWTGTAGEVRDSSGNGLHGTAYGTTTVGQFDGDDDYVDLGTIDVLAAAQNFSAEIRFKRTIDNAGDALATNHGTNNVLLAHASSLVSDHLEIGTEGPNIEIFIRYSTNWLFDVVDAGIVDNRWYHLVLTYDINDANELKLYLDGVLIKQWDACEGELTFSSDAPYSIGMSRPDGTANNYWGDFAGRIQEVTLYNRTLAAAEITSYAAGGNIPTFYSDSPLLPDTDYRYQVTAFKATPGFCAGGWETAASDSDGGTPVHDVTTDVYATNVPVLMAADKDAVEVTSNVNLIWEDKTETEQNFIIERCLGTCTGTGDFTNAVFTTGADTTTFTDDSACENTYTYRVKATHTNDPAWASQYSNLLTVSTDTHQAPSFLVDPPQLLSEEMIELSWTDNSPDETGFDIQRCTGSGCSFVDYDTDETITISAPANPGTGSVIFHDNSLVPDTVYRYRVRARKDAACLWTSTYTNIVEQNTDIDNLGILTLAATPRTSNHIDLDWNDITSHETEYIIQRCDGVCTEGGSFNVVDYTTADSTHYEDTSVCDGSEYSYRVKAVSKVFDNGNSGCWSKRSQISGITPYNPGSVIEFKVNYQAGDMQSDFDDLRFYQFTDGTETRGRVIPHYIAKYIDGQYAYVMLKTPENPENLYMYFGNPEAGAGGNPEEFMEFFDDFAGQTIDTNKWHENDNPVTPKISQNDGLQLKYANSNVYVSMVSKQTFERASGVKTLYIQATHHDTANNDFYTGMYTDNTSQSGYQYFLHATRWYSNYFRYVYENARSILASDFGYKYYLKNNMYELKQVIDTEGGARYYVRGCESCTGSYQHLNWEIYKDTRDPFTPLTTNQIMRVGLVGFSADATIHKVAVIDGDLLEAQVDLDIPVATTCGDLPQSWESQPSNIATVQTLTATAPSQLTLTPLSESSIEMTWLDNTQDEDGFRIRRCNDDTQDCTSDANFVEIHQTLTPASAVTLKFNEPAFDYLKSESVIDASGNGNHGSPYNGLTTVFDGYNYKSASFDGQNDYVRLPGDGSLENITDSSYTFSAWVNPATVPAGSDANPPANNWRYAIIARTGWHTSLYYDFNRKFGFTVYNSDDTAFQIETGETYEPGGWHHVAGVVDNSEKTIRLYVDGILKNSASFTGTLREYGVNPYYVGVATPGLEYNWYFHGQIDNARIFDHALPENEVKYLAGQYYLDQGLQMNSTYTYMVETYTDASCPWSPPLLSNRATAATTSPPAPENVIAAPIDTTTIQIDWQGLTTSHDGYHLQRSIFDGISWSPYVTIAETDRATQTFIDTEVCPGSDYKYQASAFAGLSNGNNGNWTVKTPLSITGFIVDFQIKVNVPYDAAMQPDFSDLRFIDDVTGREIPYWLESKVDNTSATVWIRTGGSNSISLYFGNPAATSSSNGNAVFEFFDAFEDTIVDTAKWHQSGISENAGKAMASSENEGWKYLRSKASFGDDVILEINRKVVGNKGGQGTSYFGFYDQAAAAPAPAATALPYSVKHIGFGEGWCADWYTCSEQANAAGRQGYTVYLDSNLDVALFHQIIRTPTMTYLYTENDAVQSDTRSISTYLPAGVPMNIFLGIADINEQYGPLAMEIEDVRVRKYAALEPTVSLGLPTAPDKTNWETAWTESNIATTDTIAVPVLDSADRVSEARIDLAWTWNHSADDQTGFEIERCEGTVCKSLTTDAQARNFADFNLGDSTSYCYSVRGLKENVTCAWNAGKSNQLCAATDIIDPDSLTAVANPQSTTRIDLGWNDLSTSETGFTIYRCEGDPATCCGGDLQTCSGGNFTALATQAGANQNYFHDDTLCNNTNYTYKIAAFSNGPQSQFLSGDNGGTWTLRAPLDISGFVADNPTRITVDYRKGMNLDFSDIRFLDETSGTELPYWIQEKTDGVAAIIWFRSASGSAVNMYYGNPDATAMENPSQIFIDFKENMTEGSLDTLALYNADGFVIEANISAVSSSYGPSMEFDVAPDGIARTRLNYQNGIVYRRDYDATGNQIKIDSLGLGNYTVNEFHTWKIKVKDSALAFFFDDVEQNFNYDYPLSHTQGTVTFGSTYAGSSYTCNYDHIFIRKYTAVDPVATVGASQSAPTTLWTSAQTNAAAATTNAPVAPVINATATDFEDQITVTWTDGNPDESFFEIQRALWNDTQQQCESWASIGTTAGPDIFTYTDNTGLSHNTTYCYRVRAHKDALCNGGWDGPWSGETQGTTTVAAPTGLTAVTRETARIDLEWTDTTSTETGFVIQRCEGDAVFCGNDPDPNPNYSWSATVSANIENYTDTSPCPGRTYTYRVGAVKSGEWTSAYSNTADTTTPMPAAPTGLTVSEVYEPMINQRQIDLFWMDANQDEKGFAIERCNYDLDADNCAGGSVGWEVITNIASHDDFAEQIDPSFWIQAGRLPTADYSYAIPVSLVDDSGSADVFWENSAAVLMTSSTGNTTVIDWNESLISVDHPEIIGTGDFDLQISFNLPDALPDETANTNHVYLRLSLDLGGDTVSIERAINTAGGYYQAGVHTGTGYTSNMQATTEVNGRFRITRIATVLTASIWKDNGWVSLASRTDGTTGRIPRLLSLNQYARQDEALTLKTAIADFKLQADSPVYTDFDPVKPLAASTNYHYRVRADHDTACNEWSGLYTNTASDLTNPASPHLTGQALGSRKIELSWDDAARDETGYILEKQIFNGRFIVIFTSGPDVTSFTDFQGIEPLNTYTYRVRSFRTQDNVTSYSAYSEEVTVPTPKHGAGGDDSSCVIP